MRRPSHVLLAGFAAAVFSVAFLSGCSRPARPENGKTVLELWNTFSLAEIKLLHELLEEYQQLHQEIEIDCQEIPHDQRETKVPLAVRSGDTPDILRADYPYQFFLAERNQLLKLDEHLAGWDGLEDIYPELWDQCTYEGKKVAVPQDGFRSVLYCNADHFEQAGLEGGPRTWEELVEYGKKLTVDLDGDGRPDRYGYGLHGKSFDATGDFLLFLHQNGGELFENDRYVPEAVAIDRPEAVETLQFYVDLVNKHRIAPPGSVSYGYSEVNDAFKGGRVSMFICGSWNIANFAMEVPKLRFTTAKLPAGRFDRTGYGACFYTVFRNTKHPKESVELVKWLVSKENIRRWSKELKHMPVRRSVFTDPVFEAPMFAAFKESVPIQMRQTPKLGIWQRIHRALEAAVQSSLLGKATPEEALHRAAAEIREAVGE